MLENFILRKAKKIEEKRKSAQEKASNDYREQYEIAKERSKKIKDVLYKSLDEIESKMVIHPLYAKEGDRVILNRYNLKFSNCMNGWDGGPGCFLFSCGDEDRNRVIFALITRVYVDRSYSLEMIDRFVDRSDLNVLEKLNCSQIESMFKKYIYDVNPDASETLGMYIGAKFVPEAAFKPSWGLSITSFLPIGCDEAKVTQEIWEEEVRIKAQLDILNEDKKRLEKRLCEIDEMYKGIRTIR